MSAAHLGRHRASRSARQRAYDLPVDAAQDPRGRPAAPVLTTGARTGAGGTGNAVRVRGNAAWVLCEVVWIASSDGRYDQAEYRRQVAYRVK